jgi:hypothetical protein
MFTQYPKTRAFLAVLTGRRKPRVQIAARTQRERGARAPERQISRERTRGWGRREIGEGGAWGRGQRSHDSIDLSMGVAPKTHNRGQFVERLRPSQAFLIRR